MNLVSHLPLWSLIAGYAILIYPWYRLCLWANQTDCWSHPKKPCTKGHRRNAILLGVFWYLPLTFIIFASVVTFIISAVVMPCEWIGEKTKNWTVAKKFRAIERWFKDETPCK